MAVFLYDSFDWEELVLLAQLHLVWLDVLQSSESSMFLPKNPQFYVPAQPIPTRTNQNMHRKLHGLSHGHNGCGIEGKHPTPWNMLSTINWGRHFILQVVKITIIQKTNDTMYMWYVLYIDMVDVLHLDKTNSLYFFSMMTYMIKVWWHIWIILLDLFCSHHYT